MKPIACIPEQTIGIDLGDRWSVCCVVDAAGQVVERFRVATTTPALERRFAARDRARVVLEVGTHSPWVSRLLRRLGHETIVADPRAVRRCGLDKNDRVDAEFVARMARVDPQLLRPVEHRGEAAQRDRMLLQSRDALVRSRVQLVTTVRGLGKALGLRFAHSSTGAFARRVREQAGGKEPFPGAEPLLEQIECLSVAIRAADRRIEALAERYAEVARLTQVRGVGVLTALTYVLTLEDPHRFKHSRSVGSYLGLRPRQHQSGDQNPQLRITRAGDALLRRLLVQCAHYILGPFGEDCDLRRFGERLMARGGRAARKRAIVAVARKLAVLLHHLWLHGERYEPLHRLRLDPAA